MQKAAEIPDLRSIFLNISIYFLFSLDIYYLSIKKNNNLIFILCDETKRRKK